MTNVFSLTMPFRTTLKTDKRESLLRKHVLFTKINNCTCNKSTILERRNLKSTHQGLVPDGSGQNNHPMSSNNEVKQAPCYFEID